MEYFNSFYAKSLRCDLSMFDFSALNFTVKYFVIM